MADRCAPVEAAALFLGQRARPPTQSRAQGALLSKVAAIVASGPALLRERARLRAPVSTGYSWLTLRPADQGILLRTQLGAARARSPTHLGSP